MRSKLWRESATISDAMSEHPTLSPEDLQELAAIAWLHGRTTGRECEADRCGCPVATQSGLAAGHAAGIIVRRLGGLDAPLPEWVLEAVKRANSKLLADVQRAGGPLN